MDEIRKEDQERRTSRCQDVKKNTHKLNGNLGVIQQIGALENDTKRALSNLLADAIVDADDIAAS